MNTVISAAGERMRRHRQRRGDKLRCLMIELREGEIEALIRQGLLPPAPIALAGTAFRFNDGPIAVQLDDLSPLSSHSSPMCLRRWPRRGWPPRRSGCP
jgi:hypothetical protein